MDFDPLPYVFIYIYIYIAIYVFSAQPIGPSCDKASACARFVVLHGFWGQLVFEASLSAQVSKADLERPFFVFRLWPFYLLPTVWVGRVPLLKKTTETSWHPYILTSLLEDLDSES